MRKKIEMILKRFYYVTSSYVFEYSFKITETNAQVFKLRGPSPAKLALTVNFCERTQDLKRYWFLYF